MEFLLEKKRCFRITDYQYTCSIRSNIRIASVSKILGRMHSTSQALLKSIFGKARRPIKVALLIKEGRRDWQSVCLKYACCRIHPAQRCDRITLKQWNLIAQTTIDILQTAITHEGSTLSDGTYRNALNDPGGYQNMHRVYDKEGQSCPLCIQTKITRIVQAQRSTFFCKACQKRR